MKGSKLLVILFIQCNIVFGKSSEVYERPDDSHRIDEVTIFINKKSPMEVFGASKVMAALQNLSIATQVIDNSDASGIEQIQLKILNQKSDI